MLVEVMVMLFTTPVVGTRLARFASCEALIVCEWTGVWEFVGIAMVRLTTL